MGCGPCLLGNFLFSRSLLAPEQEVTYPSLIVTLIFLGAKAEYLIYYWFILQKFLRTVGNRWKNKMLWTLNLALACVQEQELRSRASCQGGLVTSCRRFDALIQLPAWLFIVKTSPSCWSQPHQLHQYPGKETAKHCTRMCSAGCLWNQVQPADVFKAPDFQGS